MNPPVEKRPPSGLRCSGRPGPQALSDWEACELTHGDKTRAVFRRGSGPGVIVLHEISGITPDLICFGRRLSDEGFSVHLPHLFGVPGVTSGTIHQLAMLAWTCIAREFVVLRTGRTSPVTRWLRVLASAIGEEGGDRRVGVVGMCLTGGYALAMVLEEAVVAPVLSQPSTPFRLSASHARDLGLDSDDLNEVKRRVVREDMCVLGLRFSGDPIVPAARFERLGAELGDHFEPLEISSGYNREFGLRAHSVLAAEPQRRHTEAGKAELERAFERVLRLFEERLR